MVTNLILIVVVESLILLALVFGVLKSRSGSMAAYGILAAVSAAAPFSLGIWLAAQAGVTAVAISLFRFVRAKSRFAANWVFGPIFTLYAIILVWLVALELQDLSFARNLVRRVSALREQYPIVSVADRLGYETEQGVRAANADSDPTPPQLNSVVEQRLAAKEPRTPERCSLNSRRKILAMLHTQTNDEFVEASGFGRRRIIDPGAERYAEKLALPDLPPVLLNFPSVPPRDAEPESPTAENALATRDLPTNDELLSMHDAGTDDLVDPERMGFVKGRARVAGFQAHRFTKVPEAPANGGPHREWRIIRLELISLLKHDTPVAYVSDSLPEMDKLRDAPTRPLEEFERTSLGRLRSEEDVVIVDAPDRIRMVGSLRASRDCLDCHSARRGELLGALTYELAPVRPTRRRAQISPPSS